MGAKTALDDLPIVRLIDSEEQGRFHAFQQCLVDEISVSAYQAVVRSIIEKLIAKLAVLSGDALLYQGATQCLSDYMSALNHHSDLCVAKPPGADSPPTPTKAQAWSTGFDPRLLQRPATDACRRTLGSESSSPRRGTLPSSSPTGSADHHSSHRRVSLPAHIGGALAAHVHDGLVPPLASKAALDNRLPSLPPGAVEAVPVMPASPWVLPRGQVVINAAAFLITIIWCLLAWELEVNAAVLGTLEASHAWPRTSCVLRAPPSVATERIHWGKGHLGALGEHQIPLVAYRVDAPVTVELLHGRAANATAHRYPSGRFWELDRELFGDGRGPSERFAAQLPPVGSNVTCWADPWDGELVMLSRDPVPEESRAQAEQARWYGRILIGPTSVAALFLWWTALTIAVKACCCPGRDDDKATARALV